ncbi:MAG: EF-hand domain-containing protein [Emcibacteraceae bacterium]|nr:EF-hand domain-containing protein [Emcibacteraceae bacterium]
MTPISNSGVSSTLMQQMQQSRQNIFKDADTDSNGSLSIEEFSAAGPKDANGNNIAPPSGAPDVKEMFSSLDTDGDGSLTQSEMDAGHRKQKNDNQSNILSEGMLSELFSQLKNDAASFFNDADQDGDGNLTFDELETALAAEENEAPAAAPPPPSGGPSGPPPSDEASSDQQIFDVLDTNQDGTVSLEELLAVSEEDETEQPQEEYSENLLQSEFTKSLLTLQEQQAA